MFWKIRDDYHTESEQPDGERGQFSVEADGRLVNQGQNNFQKEHRHEHENQQEAHGAGDLHDGEEQFVLATN